jgi:hypothetical protein
MLIGRLRHNPQELGTSPRVSTATFLPLFGRGRDKAEPARGAHGHTHGSASRLTAHLRQHTIAVQCMRGIREAINIWAVCPNKPAEMGWPSCIRVRPADLPKQRTEGCQLTGAATAANSCTKTGSAVSCVCPDLT